MKKIIIQFIVLCFILLASLNIFSQEIEIDSTFNSSYEIFPFDRIESVTGMSIESEVYLNSDTSMVRVLLKDESGVQYMILELYPLICPGLYQNFSAHCDETCLLEQTNPNSIIIQVIDATLNLRSFYYTTDPIKNASEERYIAKRALDTEKIETMNQLIPAYHMNWVAGDNSLVAMYYDQKRNLFGGGYNLRGYDYYTGGVFEALGHRPYPIADPNLVRTFDWRNRHGANDSLSLYWDGDTLGTGWLTSVKNQGSEGSCYAFGPLGAGEALTNVYTNSQVDFDLSERYFIACFNPQCNASSSCVMDRLIDTGAITENCLPYIEYHCYDTCAPIDTFFKITDKEHINHDNPDSIRLALINNGPLLFNYIPTGTLEGHSVTLTGYKFNFVDSTITWIIKNSYGDSVGVRGFYTMPLDNITDVYAPIGPVKVNDSVLPVYCHDYDNDGYYFWGIGKKPKNCPVCSDTEDCDDNDSLVGGYDENYNCKCNLVMDTVAHHISTDTNWSDTTYVNYEVIIDSGACLTISSYAAFAPQAYIVVSQGGELIVDGGYLTKACPELWEGIEVWGSDTTQYLDEFFGKVVMTNNAVIEFAKTGIANYCTRCTSNQMQSGGIILADSSIFRDNETDVKFASFQNIWLGREYPSVGSFVKCHFITTDNFYPENTPKVHLDIRDIFEITIAGCTFKNESDMKLYPYPYRGTGIFGIDAQFTLKTYCNNPNINPCNDLDSCKFIGLEYGIKALNSTSMRTLNIQDILFESNLLAISLSGIDNASVLSNDILCPVQMSGISDERFKGGIFLENSTGYHVEGNFIHGVLGQVGSFSPAYGIGIKNSGPDNNEIYNNSFFRVNTGIIVLGENRYDGDSTGLCLKCNKMDFNYNDFVVFEDTNTYFGDQGIRLFQGNPDDTISDTSPAGNIFSDMPFPALNNSYYNYRNEAENIWYIHHSRHEQFIVFPEDSNYTHETIELVNQHIEFDESRACPSRLEGGGLKAYTNPRQNLQESEDHIAFLQNQMNELIDGGNTEELNYEILSSFPQDGLEIRQELLDASPFLSDTVMKQAIYHEDVLPNAMIRDVLEANPQSAKSSDVLNSLDQRFEPMPDYMMAQVMEGRFHFGAKELLEAKIQYWKQTRSRAKYDLMRLFLSDTTLVDRVDSVIAFLESENDLRSKYDLAFAYWNRGDSANALAVLNGIPGEIILSSDQIRAHQCFTEYFSILNQMEDSNWRPCDLDLASVQQLFNLMNCGNTDLAAHARGLLVKGGFLNYIETVSKPYSIVSTMSKKYDHKYPGESRKTDCFSLFPNPAGDYVIAYYDIGSNHKEGIIKIHDMHGNFIRQYPLISGKNQVVLQLKNLPIGIYIVGLYLNNRLLGTKKLCKAVD